MIAVGLGGLTLLTVAVVGWFSARFYAGRRRAEREDLHLGNPGMEGMK
jgi:hypothetical protein